MTKFGRVCKRRKLKVNVSESKVIIRLWRKVDGEESRSSLEIKFLLLTGEELLYLKVVVRLRSKHALPNRYVHWKMH